jgi:hypothetical protein
MTQNRRDFNAPFMELSLTGWFEQIKDEQGRLPCLRRAAVGNNSRPQASLNQEAPCRCCPGSSS